MFVTGNISSRFPSRVLLPVQPDLVYLEYIGLPQREGVTVHQKMHAYGQPYGAAGLPRCCCFSDGSISNTFETALVLLVSDFQQQMAPLCSFRQKCRS